MLGYFYSLAMVSVLAKKKMEPQVMIGDKRETLSAKIALKDCRSMGINLKWLVYKS